MSANSLMHTGVILITFISVVRIWLYRMNTTTRSTYNSGEVVDQMQHLAGWRNRHEISALLLILFEHDGAGEWPPKSNHDIWPEPLKPYKDIYLELVSTLSTAKPSLDDSVNDERRSRYRASMRKLLAYRIDMTEVTRIMQKMESGDLSELPRDAINGFYCCVAVCRHAYRWATIPVVKVAQLETIIDFPPELGAPWLYLQRYFDVDADSGNNTANVLHNFNEKGDRVYKINIGMSDLITSSEETFFRMFYDLEVLAMPIYCDMAGAIVTFTDGDKVESLRHLQQVTTNLQCMLRIFYKRLTESGVSDKVWLSYIQGFKGWGVGRMINGEYIRFDGLSGNHVLIFQALDAFLGIEQYLTDDAMKKYIPGNQRKLCTSLRNYGYRNRLNSLEDECLKVEISKIVNRLKVGRYPFIASCRADNLGVPGFSSGSCYVIS